jgi:hypothetical protein
MDLLLIPVLLGIGGGLIYLGANGVPQLPSLRGEPFRMADWMKSRAASGRAHVERGRPTSHDAELVELMNEMIAVREELSGLRERMEAMPAKRHVARKTTTTAVVRTTTTPVKPQQPELPAAVVETRPAEARAKLPLPAKAEAPQRRQAFAHSSRRYVRAH